MKRTFWLGLLAWLSTYLLHAQSLAGTWQGVEDPGSAEHYCPTVLRLQASKDKVFGILYQESGIRPSASVNFQLEGSRTGNTLQMSHRRKLNETGGSISTYWCEGAITFTYNAALERLTGHARYRIMGQCDTGRFVLYRVLLKSAATVAAGVPSTLRVSGREVEWFADAACTKPLASGNTFRTRLSKTTTYYLTQGYYPSGEKVVTPVTVQVGRPPQPTPRPAVPRPPVASAPRPEPARPTLPPLDTARRRPPVVAPPAALLPTVLPTVLFKQGTPELLPEAAPRPRQARRHPAGQPRPAPAHCRPHRPRGRAGQKPGAFRAASNRRQRLFGEGRGARRAARNHWLRRHPAPAFVAGYSQPARGSREAVAA